MRLVRKADPAVVFEGPLFGKPAIPARGAYTVHAYTQSAIEVSYQPGRLNDFLGSSAGALVVPLREGHREVVEVKEVLQRGPVTHTLVGKVRGKPLSEVLLVFHDGAVGGQVVDQAANDHYEFGLAGNGNIAIRRLAAEKYTAPCGQPGDSETAAEMAGAAYDSASSPAGQPFAGERNEADSVVTMDLVVGYDRDSRLLDGGVAGIEARIIASVDHMNLAFANSLVSDTQVVLLGTIEDPDYTYPGRVSGDMGSADELGGLNNETDGYLDTVSNFRRQLGADQNSFVIADADGSAGIAYRPGKAMIVARTYMTSTRITFAHEFGHNIGARHSWGDSASDVLTTVSNYGWRFDPPGVEVPVRTIMAYDWGWGNGVRIPHFSNPSVFYAGARTGAVDGYNATGDSTVDQRYVSGGYIGTAGAGFNGSKPLLGARNADYLKANAPTMAARTVRVQQPLPAITSALALTVVRGQSVDYTITTDSPVLGYSATGLPPGLAFNAASGVISGTALEAGSFPISLSAVGSGGTGAALLIVRVLEIQNITFETVPQQLATATLPLTATGGGSGNPVTFEVVSGPGYLEAGNILKFVTSGEVLVRAAQAASPEHAAAEPVTRVILVVKAPALVHVSSQQQYYTGAPRSVQTVTEPPNLPVSVFYNGLLDAPSLDGSYTVVARVDHAQYTGEAVTMMDILRPQIRVVSEPLPPRSTFSTEQSFGTAAPGQQVERGFRISNAGTGYLDLGSLTLSGTHGQEYGYDAPDSIHLGPGQSTLLKVHFRPLTAGEKIGVLVMATNDVDAPEWRMSLTGRADHRADKAVETPLYTEEEGDSESVGWTHLAVSRYEGLVTDAGDGKTIIGSLENFVTAKSKSEAEGGAFSARLKLGRTTTLLKGLFDRNGIAALRLPQKDGSQILMDIRLEQAGMHREIRGSLVWQGLTGQVKLVACSHSKTNPVSGGRSGRFTMLLPSQSGWGEGEPGGDGWAALQISSSGAVSMVGKLAEGTAITRSTALADVGFVALYQNLPSVDRSLNGSLAGWLRFREMEAISDLDGQVQWRMPADERRPQYPAGFGLTIDAIGCRLAAPGKASPLLAGLLPADPNASLSLICNSLSAGGEVEYVISWTAGDSILHYGPAKLKATVNRTTGVLSGSYADPTSGVQLSFQGVVFQKQDLAAGQFIWGGQSGALRIRPGTGYTYPGSLPPEHAAAVRTAEVAGPASPSLSRMVWESSAQGGYSGLWNCDTLPAGALENLRITGQGLFTATLWINGKKQAIRGSFLEDGSAVVDLEKGSMQLRLQLNQAEEPNCVLSGTLSVNGVAHELCAVRQGSYPKGLSSAHAGTYTLAMLAGQMDSNSAVNEPLGDGYGCLKVSPSGSCSGSLVLADGTRTTFGGFVSPQGEWNFYRSVHAGGFVAGQLCVRPVAAVSDLDGEWHWSCPANAAAGGYVAGFQTQRKVVACLYQAPARKVRAWAELPDGWYNAWVRLHGSEITGTAGLAETHVDRVVTWNPENQLVYFGPDSLGLKFYPATGLLMGTWRHKARGYNQTFGGVLLQKQALVTGAYVSRNGGGRFWMEAR